MRKKIFIYYVILIFTGVSLTGFFASQLTRKLYEHEVVERLKITANLIKHQLSENRTKGIPFNYDDIAGKYTDILDSSLDKDKYSVSKSSAAKISRITFIDYNGNVLGESGTRYESMENHSNRKEIQQALKGVVGTDKRFSNTLKMDFIYLAVPLEFSDVLLRVAVPLTQIRLIDRVIVRYSLMGILVGLIATILLAYKFSNTLAHPINELISVSGEISRGNYKIRVDAKSDDELGDLAETFNDMAEKLENTVADITDKNLKMDSIINSMTDAIIAVDSSCRIILINTIAYQLFSLEEGSRIIGTNILELLRNNTVTSALEETLKINASTVNDITTGSEPLKILRVRTNPIKSAKGEMGNSGAILTIQDITNIKKLEQMRTEFVSNVTHELKTPLTSIRGFVETLKNGAIDDRKVAEKFLEIIDIEAERLYMLINDILQLSEIEIKQKDTNITTCKFEPLILDVFSLLQSAADKKGVELKYEAEKNLTINVNKDRVKQMLINLVDNAIKYNKSGGKVFVKASRGEGRIVITVKDTGIGIAPEHTGRIFERFYRVDKGRSRSMGGTGLGLSIVKHIVNLYNGSVSVDSQVGKGTEFIVQLPVQC